MGQFFRTVFASCLGVILATIVLGAISFAIFGSLASFAEKPTPVKANSVIHLKLEEQIPDKTNNVEATTFKLNDTEVLGLQDIIATIKRAAKDDDIKGIYLSSNWSPLSLASTNSLRQALLSFQESGKFVIAYADYYTQGGYYLASTADHLFLNPVGLIDLRGLASVIPFYKNMLDKVGIKMEVFYAGKYKSATEPFRREEMSPENREQTRVFLDEMYSMMLENLSESRDIPISQIKSSIDRWAGADASVAKQDNLVDELAYKDQVMAQIRDEIGLDEDEKINFISIKAYKSSKPAKTNYNIKDKIAVVYAEGTIVDGNGENGTVGGKRYVKIIEDITKNNNVKAIVLRVNSPGGSAMASENIWRALTIAKDKGLPIVTSMADYAASGGYYIAALSDSIVAQPMTITGSIGVFSMFPEASKLFNEKLGINFDTVNTGALSSGFSATYPLGDLEKQILQRRADSTYKQFLTRVSNGRNMTIDQVNEIAQGRVWTGQRAQQNGLVDILGDLETAKSIAANMAGLTDYRVLEYPKVKDPIEKLLEELMNPSDNDVSSRFMQRELKEWYPYYKELKNIRDSKGLQMRMLQVVPFR